MILIDISDWGRKGSFPNDFFPQKDCWGDACLGMLFQSQLFAHGIVIRTFSFNLSAGSKKEEANKF